MPCYDFECNACKAKREILVPRPVAFEEEVHFPENDDESPRCESCGCQSFKRIMQQDRPIARMANWSHW